MRNRGANYNRLRRRARRLVANDEQLLSALAAMREDKNISLEVVSRRMGVTEAELEAIDGGTKDPTMGELRRYAHAVGAVVEHRVINDEADADNQQEPVIVTHECGQIELSSVIHNPQLGPISRIDSVGASTRTTVRVETTPA